MLKQQPRFELSRPSTAAFELTGSETRACRDVPPVLLMATLETLSCARAPCARGASAPRQVWVGLQWSGCALWAEEALTREVWGGRAHTPRNPPDLLEPSPLHWPSAGSSFDVGDPRVQGAELKFQDGLHSIKDFTLVPAVADHLSVPVTKDGAVQDETGGDPS